MMAIYIFLTTRNSPRQRWNLIGIIFYYLAATDYTHIFKYKKHNSAPDVQIIYNEDLIVNLSMIQLATKMYTRLQLCNNKSVGRFMALKPYQYLSSFLTVLYKNNSSSFVFRTRLKLQIIFSYNRFIKKYSQRINHVIITQQVSSRLRGLERAVRFRGTMIDATGNKAPSIAICLPLSPLFSSLRCNTETGSRIVFYTDQQCRPHRSPIIGEKVPKEPILLTPLIKWVRASRWYR